MKNTIFIIFIFLLTFCQKETTIEEQETINPDTLMVLKSDSSYLFCFFDASELYQIGVNESLLLLEKEENRRKSLTEYKVSVLLKDPTINYYYKKAGKPEIEYFRTFSSPMHLYVVGLDYIYFTNDPGYPDVQLERDLIKAFGEYAGLHQQIEEEK